MQIGATMSSGTRIESSSSSARYLLGGTLYSRRRNEYITMGWDWIDSASIFRIIVLGLPSGLGNFPVAFAVYPGVCRWSCYTYSGESMNEKKALGFLMQTLKHLRRALINIKAVQAHIIPQARKYYLEEFEAPLSYMIDILEKME